MVFQQEMRKYAGKRKTNAWQMKVFAVVAGLRRRRRHRRRKTESSFGQNDRTLRVNRNMS